MAIRKLTYSAAIAEGMAEEMRRDDRVIQTGLDVGFYGDAFGQTLGMFEEFGKERMIDFPISEMGFTGVCVGAAATGLRPVTTIQFNDWMTLASDQIINQAAFMRYMYGGVISVPMVVRTCCGGYMSAAAQHSKMMDAWFTNIPGLKVVCPSTPADAKGLIKSAIRDNNPVLYYEHKVLYAKKGEVDDDPEVLVPIGKADIKRKGADVTIVTYSYMVHLALQAAKELEAEGIDVEVLDLRSLKPLDEDAIYASVRKTNRVVCLQEGWKNCGIMSEVAALIAENAMDALKAPVVRVTSKEAPIPFNPTLEKYVLPSVQDIKDAVLKVTKG